MGLLCWSHYKQIIKRLGQHIKCRWKNLQIYACLQQITYGRCEAKCQHDQVGLPVIDLSIRIDSFIICVMSQRSICDEHGCPLQRF
jgi:hypothetical protein